MRKLQVLMGVGWLSLVGCHSPRVVPDGAPAVAVPTQTQLLAEADKVFRSREYEQSRGLYLAVLEEAERVGDNSTAVEALSQVARTYLITDHKEEGRLWLEKARVRATPTEPAGWGRYLGVRGRLEWKDEQLEVASRTFTEQYDFCLAHNLFEMSIDAAHMVALVAPPDQQITWAHKGIAAAEQGNLPGWLGPLWNNLGYTHESLGDYQLALDCYLKARSYHYAVGDTHARYVADWTVGHTYRLLGQFEEAEKWLGEALLAAEKADDGEFVGLNHEDLGEIDRAKGATGEARAHFVVAYEKLDAAGAREWDPERMSRLEGYLREDQ